jgi:type II secretory pathway pseudopilin PulG
VILVAVVLVILGTMLAPRMVGATRGRFSAAAEGVATSMATFAFHEATDDRPVALAYQARERRLDVLVLGSIEGQRGAEWRPMPMAPSVILPDDFEFVRVTVDQALLDPTDWFIATPPSGRRPDVRLRLESEAGDGAEIVLTPHALAPLIVRDGDPEAPYIREAADLDGMGAGRESW